MDVPAGHAAAHPLAGSHSIWEIVRHVASWQSIATAALSGNPVPPWPFPEDWPGVQAYDEGSWRAALDELERVNAELVRVTGGLTDARLEETVPGRDYSVYYLLHGVAQHNLYHAGQIALLKKASVQHQEGRPA